MTFDETLQRLFERRILLPEEDLNDSCCGRLRVDFIKLNLRDSQSPIRIYIDTRKGDVDAVLELVSTMQTIDAPIIGLVDGRCDAHGLALLQACDVRLTTRFPSYYIRPISTSSSFFYTGPSISGRYEAYGNHLEQLQKMLDSVIIGTREGAGLRSLHLHEYYEQQKVFRGEDAVRFGFADQVIEKEGFWTGEQILIPSKIGFQR